MGYSHYLYEIDKSVVKEITDLSIKELIKQFMPPRNQDYFDPGNLPTERLYDLGQYIEYAERIHATGKPLFTREDTNRELEE